MAKWIKADGNVVEVSTKNAGKCFTLEELKGFVGGLDEVDDLCKAIYKKDGVN